MTTNSQLVVPNLPVRLILENLLVSLKNNFPQGHIDIIETSGGKMYARTGLIKKGTELVGKIHKLEHINIMSSGDITVVTEEGCKRLVGFNIMVCKPGTRRAGRANEDTIWTTILQTEETDLAKIEEMFFYKSHEEMEQDYVC